MWLTGSRSDRQVWVSPLEVRALPQAPVNEQSLVPSLMEHQRGTKRLGHPAHWTRCLIQTRARRIDGVWTLKRKGSQPTCPTAVQELVGRRQPRTRQITTPMLDPACAGKLDLAGSSLPRANWKQSRLQQFGKASRV